MNSNHNASEIVEISRVNKTGFYAPLTNLHNFFVGETNDSMYLVHCFANVQDPQKLETYFDIAMAFLDLFVPVDKHNYNEDFFINPNVAHIMYVFGDWVDIKSTGFDTALHPQYSQNTHFRQLSSESDTSSDVDQEYIIFLTASNYIQYLISMADSDEYVILD